MSAVFQGFFFTLQVLLHFIPCSALLQLIVFGKKCIHLCGFGTYWSLYLFNLFAILTCSVIDLHVFMCALNDNIFNLKFTMQCQSVRIPFLVVEIYVQDDGSIATTLYRKPTAGNTILHAQSSLPPVLVNCIPYRQLWHHCTDGNKFQCHTKSLQMRLLARGYSKFLVIKHTRELEQPLDHH